MAGVARLESFVFFGGRKQRFHPFHFKFHFNIGRKLSQQFFHCIGNVLFGVHGGADCRKEMGMVRFNHMFAVQLQGADESGFQLGEEM